MMRKQSWLLAGAAVLLAGIYAWFFTDWLTPRRIHIYYVARPPTRSVMGARVAAGNKNTDIVTFGMDSRYSLTEIKVVRLSEWQTNHFAEPLWHLVTDSNSAPVKMFPYGVALRGMRPAVAKKWPDPLEPNVVYRIFVSAGHLHGEHDFSAPARPPGKSPA